MKNTVRKPPAAGRGRPKGARNKVTSQLKDMILGALSDVGGQAYFAEQAKANPTAFLTLVGKVLPVTLQESENPPPVQTNVALNTDWATLRAMVAASIKQSERENPKTLT